MTESVERESTFVCARLEEYHQNQSNSQHLRKRHCIIHHGRLNIHSQSARHFLAFLLLIHFSKFEISEGTYITLKMCLLIPSLVPSGFQVLSRLYSSGSTIGVANKPKIKSFKSLNHRCASFTGWYANHLNCRVDNPVQFGPAPFLCIDFVCVCKISSW